MKHLRIINTDYVPERELAQDLKLNHQQRKILHLMYRAESKIKTNNNYEIKR